MSRVAGSIAAAAFVALVVRTADADEPTADPASPAAEPALTTPPAPEKSVAEAPSTDSPTAPSPPPVRPVRFTGTIGAVSLPRPLSLELLARFRKAGDARWDSFAVGAGIEYLPGGVANFGDKTTLSWMQVGADGRFFLYRWLFAGARVGYQFSRADSEKFGSEVDYVTTSLFVAPKVGALYTFKSGLTIGGELGASIPLLAGTSIESDGQTDSNARKASKTFGMFLMPFVGLRVGWTI